jgi:hypothetical protein
VLRRRRYQMLSLAQKQIFRRLLRERGITTNMVSLQTFIQEVPSKGVSRLAFSIELFSLRKYFLQFLHNSTEATFAVGSPSRCNDMTGQVGLPSPSIFRDASVPREENKNDIAFNVGTQRHQHSRIRVSLQTFIQEVPSSSVNRLAFSVELVSI